MKGMSFEITEDVIARQPPEAQAIIHALLAKIVKLETELEYLRRQVKGKTPQNSSLPPSTQHPHAKPKSRKRKSKKKRGGQPGHKKHERPLIPTDECDDVQRVKPTECRRCGERLSGSDPEPLRHQVWELPKIKPHVTEYQRHRLACPGCGETTCASLPEGVPPGQSGPRLMAFTALLMAYYRQSKRRTAEFLTTLLGQPCCAALTVKMQTQVTAAARPAYEELAASLPTQGHVNADETGTDLAPETESSHYVSRTVARTQKWRARDVQEAAHGRADHSKAPRSGSTFGTGCYGWRGLQEAGDHRTDVLSMEEGIRQPACGSSQAVEGA